MSHYSSMEEDPQEMHTSVPLPPSSHPPLWPARFASMGDHFEGPSLDLQLSISVKPLRRLRQLRGRSNDHSSSAEALKWQAAEQIRLAAMEKAYAERVMELTRREMELAQSEFLRARSLWERAIEEVERAEKMKERATQKASDSCMEITCLSCRQKFRA